MQTIYIRPRPDYGEDSYVEWSVNKEKWYPISHIYVGMKDELPPPGYVYRTAPPSSLKKELDALWGKGLTVTVVGDYSRETKRLIIAQIVKEGI